ncbi:MAG: hypothetical protein ACTHKR_13805 [Sphingomonas sp.]
MKVFGAGCVYFGYDDEVTGREFDRERFLVDLRGRLEKVENVSNIEFSGFSGPAFGGILTLQRDDADALVPILHDGSKFSFDIFIPFRMQRSFGSVSDVEMVHVDVVYGYEMPLMFVSYDWPEEEGDAQPAIAVVSIRKYLANKLSTEGFRCDCVGPSPFHANFSIVEHDLDEFVRLEDVSPNRDGYSLIELNVSAGTALLDALVASNLISTLSLFYQLSELRSQLIDHHFEITEKSKILLRKDEPKKNIFSFKSWFSDSSAIDAVKKSLFYEALLRIEMSDSLSEGERSEYIGDGQTMNYFFAEFRAMSSEERWANFSAIADFFEERRQKALGNLINVVVGLASGVTGAVIGSVATFLLSK